jgi:hypothetical protein
MYGWFAHENFGPFFERPQFMVHVFATDESDLCFRSHDRIQMSSASGHGSVQDDILICEAFDVKRLAANVDAFCIRSIKVSGIVKSFAMSDLWLLKAVKGIFEQDFWDLRAQVELYVFGPFGPVDQSDEDTSAHVVKHLVECIVDEIDSLDWLLEF